VTCGADNAIRISGGPQAGADARAVLTAELDGRIGESGLRDVHLLTSEVVNNCVVHGGVDRDGWIDLTLAVGGDCLRVSVRDSGSKGQPVRREPDLEHGGGFGLFLVESMAARWGAENDPGLVVWFEIDLNG
jgi:anti-sigma regulatory factor (Ser/Thr protein kinase)